MEESISHQITEGGYGPWSDTGDKGNEYADSRMDISHTGDQEKKGRVTRG